MQPSQRVSVGKEAQARSVGVGRGVEGCRTALVLLAEALAFDMAHLRHHALGKVGNHHTTTTTTRRGRRGGRRVGTMTFGRLVILSIVLITAFFTLGTSITLSISISASTPTSVSISVSVVSVSPSFGEAVGEVFASLHSTASRISSAAIHDMCGRGVDSRGIQRQSLNVEALHELVGHLIAMDTDFFLGLVVHGVKQLEIAFNHRPTALTCFARWPIVRHNAPVACGDSFRRCHESPHSTHTSRCCPTLLFCYVFFTPFHPKKKTRKPCRVKK